MSNKILLITDPLDSLNIKKDTSVLIMEEALSMNFDVYQCELKDLYLKNKKVWSDALNIKTANKTELKTKESKSFSLNDFKYTFMRKDPPVDQDYINALHLLGLAKQDGVKIFNDPDSIKKFNEKVFAIYFKEFIPSTLITSNLDKILKYKERFQSIVVKPLDGMGGKSIYKIDTPNENNIQIIKNLTQNEKTKIIAQEFLEDIYKGDYRILIIHGKPFHKTLARIPQGDSFKGNLAAGGFGQTMDLTPKQKEVGELVGDILIKENINFAGIDMIGDKLTEINITSPTCAREIFDESNSNPVREYLEKL